MTETVETKPNELQLVIQESGIEPTKQNQIVEALGQFFNKVPEWEQMIAGIIITDPAEVGKMKMAREARLSLKDTRNEAKKFVESKRNEVKARMANDVLEDKLWLKLFQIMEATFKNLESKAEEKEKFAERWEAENKEKLRTERTALLSPYVDDVSIYPLGDFNEDSFQNLLNGQKLAHQAKIEEAKRIEEERIAKEKAEAEERERIKVENERLKKEAEERQKAEQARLEAERIEREKAEAAFKKQQDEKEAAFAKERAEAAKRERTEREAREKAEAILMGKEAAEKKAKADEEKRIEQQRKEKDLAEKKAKRAPDKQKLTDLSTAIKLISIPQCKSEEGKAIIENTRQLIDKLTKYIEDNADKL